MIKVGDKVRIKSREYFIEKYGTHDSILRLPFGTTPVKETLLDTTQTVHGLYRADALEVMANYQRWTFKLEDVDLVPQRSVKELR